MDEQLDRPGKEMSEPEPPGTQPDEDYNLAENSGPMQNGGL